MVNCMLVINEDSDNDSVGPLHCVYVSCSRL